MGLFSRKPKVKKLAAKKAAAALVELLTYADAEIRAEARRALRDIGAKAEAVPALIEQLAHPERELRYEALCGLEEMGDRASVVHVHPLLDATEDDVRAKAHDVVFAHKAEASVPFVLAMAAPDRDGELRFRAVQLLVKHLTSDGVAEALEAALMDPDRFCRSTAFDALRRLRGSDTAFLAKCVANPHADVRDAAAPFLEMLVRQPDRDPLTEDVVAAVAAGVRAATEAKRKNDFLFDLCNRLVREDLDGGAGSFLRGALRDTLAHQNPDLRVAALQALKTDASVETAGAVFGRFTDPDADVRGWMQLDFARRVAAAAAGRLPFGLRDADALAARGALGHWLTGQVARRHDLDALVGLFDLGYPAHVETCAPIFAAMGALSHGEAVRLHELSHLSALLGSRSEPLASPPSAPSTYQTISDLIREPFDALCAEVDAIPGDAGDARERVTEVVRDGFRVGAGDDDVDEVIESTWTNGERAIGEIAALLAPPAEDEPRPSAADWFRDASVRGPAPEPADLDVDELDVLVAAAWQAQVVEAPWSRYATRAQIADTGAVFAALADRLKNDLDLTGPQILDVVEERLHAACPTCAAGLQGEAVALLSSLQATGAALTSDETLHGYLEGRCPHCESSQLLLIWGGESR